MKKHLSERVLLCLIAYTLFFISSPLFSAGKGETVPAVKDPEKDWILYIGPIQAEAADEDLEKIAEQFRIALHSSMKHLDYHHFNVDEKREYEKFLYDNALSQLRKELSKLYWEQDRLFLNGKEERLKSLEDKIGSIRRRIAESSYPVLPDKKAIAIREEKDRESFLSLLEKKGAGGFLDLSIRPSVNSYIVEGNLYLPFFPNEHQSLRVRFKPEQIESAASELVSQMNKRLLGRPWASLTLPGQPLALTLYEGKERLSPKECLRLFPGYYKFIVSAPGYYPESLELFLLPGENRMINVTMKEKPSLAWMISSKDPEGIDIYLDGEYMGRTPIQVETNTLPGMVRGEQEHYLGQELIISDKKAEAEAFSFQLLPDGYDREDLLHNDRKQFYNRFGLFLLSLPVTMVSYGNSIAYASAANTIPDEELIHSNNLWYTAYLGGLFLNVMFGVDMIVQLVNYLDRYERFHRIERR